MKNRSRRWPVAVCAAFLWTFGSAGAWGHGGRPVPRKIYNDPAGQLQAVVSSDLGLHVTEDEGNTWFWICEDIVGFDVVDFGLAGTVGASASDRVWLAGGTGITQDVEPVFVSGLYRSTDGGCNWQPAGGGFGEQWTSGLSVNPQRPGRVVVTTDHTAMSNGIAVSDDGGLTWTWAIEGRDTKFGTLFRAPSDPDVLYATATSSIVRSDDDGATWVTVLSDIVEADFDELAVHAIDPEDPLTVYFSRLGGDGRWLYVSRDGGASAQILLKPDTWEFQAATVVATDDVGGRMIMVGTSFGDGFRSVDGGETWDTFFTDVESIDCLTPDFDEPGYAWVCSNPFVQIITPGETVKAIGRTNDAAQTVDRYFSYTDTTDFRHCPADSQVQQVCVGLVTPDAGGDVDAGGEPDVGPDEDIPAADAQADAAPDVRSGGSDDPGGCACDQGGRSAAGALCWALAFTVRGRVW